MNKSGVSKGKLLALGSERRTVESPKLESLLSYAVELELLVNSDEQTSKSYSNVRWESLLGHNCIKQTDSKELLLVELRRVFAEMVAHNCKMVRKIDGLYWNVRIQREQLQEVSVILRLVSSWRCRGKPGEISYSCYIRCLDHRRFEILIPR